MKDNKSFFDRLNQWVRASVGLKVITIAILILLLLIPVAMIESLIREREMYQQSVINEVSEVWGAHQSITAVVLTVPYYVYNTVNENGEEKVVRTKKFAHFLPDQLNIKGELIPEKRYRGIYEVIVYNCNLDISGSFTDPDFTKLNIRDEYIEWSQASLSLGITDLRSIQENIVVEWNGASINFDPGVKNDDVIYSGVSTFVPVEDSLSSYQFRVKMNFNGSNGIGFTPLGKTTRVTINSNWPGPSFTGAFLPDKRDISDSGFVAHWEVLHLNRNYPQEFSGEMNTISTSNFGVNLLMPVDQYQKSMRSVKYAVMFIALTFLVYFFAHIKNRVRIHPIQYLIIGLAICLFFTLLIALSEHIPFGVAYIIGAAATILMVTAYSVYIFRQRLLTQLLAGILIILYGFIYIIIQMQDYSLLIGSIGLFVILAIVMYLSRNIDWYNINKEDE